MHAFWNPFLAAPLPAFLLIRVFLLLTVVIHLSLAAMLLGHCRHHDDDPRHGGAANGILWATATLIGGVLVAMWYWSAHATPVGNGTPDS